MAKARPAPGGGWERPERVVQLDLFSQPRDRLLALARVSIDAMERWRALGWISFDVRDEHSLDEGRASEICFVRDLARSGLSDLQIGELLGELDPPYMYDPLRTAYSFAFGWVQLPLLPTADQREEYIEHHLPAWIQSKALLGEHELLTHVRQEILLAMVHTRVGGKPEPEEG